MILRGNKTLRRRARSAPPPTTGLKILKRPANVKPISTASLPDDPPILQEADTGVLAVSISPSKPDGTYPAGFSSTPGMGSLCLTNPAMIFRDSGSRFANLIPIPGGKELQLGCGFVQTTRPVASNMCETPGRVKRTWTSLLSGSGCWVLMKIPPPLIFLV